MPNEFKSKIVNGILKILPVLVIPIFIASTCKKNPLDNPETGTIKLLATLNDSDAIISVTDTLKITLSVPDTLQIVSNTGGSTLDTPVRSVQSCKYDFTFYYVDTLTKAVTRIRDETKIFVTSGNLAALAEVSTITHRPFFSVLNLIPPCRGLFYVQVEPEQTLMTVNNSLNAGLRVNFDVEDKHWNINARFFNSPNQPDFITSVNSLNTEGYGFYCFRVN